MEGAEDGAVGDGGGSEIESFAVRAGLQGDLESIGIVRAGRLLVGNIFNLVVLCGLACRIEEA